MNTVTKTRTVNTTAYATKATAVRGAKRLSERFSLAGQFDKSVSIEQENGTWYVVESLTTVEEIPDIVEEVKTTPDTQEPVIRGESTCESPVKTVWRIADEMTKQGKKRGEIIDACVAAGVAYYTARTQYQHFYTVNKNQNKAK